MIDLITNIPAIIGGALALIAAVWGYGKAKERKGRKTGADQVRRRAAAGAENREEKRDEIDNEVIRTGADAARDSLRGTWADK